MDENNLDEFFKEQVFYHQTPVDENALWQKIQIKQKKKSRKRLIWIWMASFAFLAIVTTWGIDCFWGTAQSNTVVDSNKSIETLESVAVQGQYERTKPTESNDFVALNKISINKERTLLPENTAQVKEVSLSDDSKIIENQQTITTSGASVKEETKLVPSTQNSRTAESPMTQSKFQKSFLPLLETRPLFVQYDQKIPALFSSVPPSSNSLRQNSANEKRWHSSIGAFAHYGISQKKLNTQDESFTPYQSLREASETSLDVFRTGIDFQVKHKTGLYGKVGLEYHRITDKFETSETETNTYLSDNQLVQIIKHGDGTISEIYDTAFVTDIIVDYKKVYNRFQMMEWAISIGYELPSQNRWHFFSEIGTSFNLFMRSSGEIFDDSRNAYSLKDDENNWFKNQIGMALSGSVGLGYDLNKHWGVWMSPAFKYHLSSFSSLANPLKQKYNSFGMNLGLRYEFR